MNVPADDLASLFAYNAWADAKTVDSIRPLPPESYTRGLGGGWPSLRATLVHLASATDNWAERFEGRDATRLLTEEELPTLGDAEGLLQRSQRRFEALLPTLGAERLREPFAWRNLQNEVRTAPTWVVLRHVVNHASYHRGQVSSMVRRLGGTPAPTDMVRWGIEVLSRAR
ncbi:hypothetical protein FBQ97_10280 [Acidobacteria bacterium ACD]|nr:MAG: hypothetical protein EDX89_15860 [Acidobacteriota bacterium]MCE7958227.1 hypothetical protein [Acidobacteria bacterium ACB2]MDL1950186.1 hypothetical protein [Acidobacteria bacterium ACD]